MAQRSQWLRQFAMTGLLVTSVASAVAAVFFFRTGMEYYRRELEVRLDPSGYRAPVAATGRNLKKIRVAFLGDSRAAMWPVPELPYEFINLGVSHQTSAQVALRAERQLRETQPHLVILQVGVNDLKAISVMPSRQLEIETAFVDHIRDIVRLARQNGAIVVVTSVFPTGKPTFTDRMRWNSSSEGAIVNVNRKLQELGVNFVDTKAILGDVNNGFSQEYSADLLHLNARGYAKLNMFLASYLPKFVQTDSDGTQRIRPISED